MTVGDKLKRWRQASGLTLDTMASQYGIHRTQLSEYENGKRPGLLMAFKIEKMTDGAITMQDWARELDIRRKSAQKKIDQPPLVRDGEKVGSR